MTEHTAVRDGVQLNQIVINSASPAVLEAICKKITDEVMAQIPDASIKNIAEDVIKSGVVVHRSRDSWNNHGVDTWRIADRTGLVLKEKLEKQIQGTLEDFWRNAQVQAEVRDLIRQAFVKAMAQLPALVSHYLVQRLAGNIASPEFANNTMDALLQADVELSKLRAAVERAGLPVDPKA